MIAYFKSRQQSDPVVYVEDENGWRSYAPGGIIQKNVGPLPNYLRQHVDELPFDEVIDLIRACEAEAELRARERALEPAGPWGIGGWLVLPIIGLSITALWSLVDIFRYLPGMWRAWDALTSPGSDAYHPLWGPYVGFASFVQFFLVLVPVFLLWLIGKKKRVLPLVIVCFYAALLSFILIDFVGVVTFISQWAVDRGFASDVSAEIFDSVQRVWKGIVFCGIWIPYFLFSSRVRATFTEPWSEQARRRETEARRSVIAALAAESRIQREHASAAAPAEEGRAAESIPVYQPAPLPQPVPSHWPQAQYRPAKTRKVVLIPVIGVLVIVVGVVTGLAVWRDNHPPQPRSAAAGNTQLNTDLTMRYSNSAFSYSFDYPRDWVVQEAPVSDPTQHEVSVYDPWGEQVDGLSLDLATFGALKGMGGLAEDEVFASLEDGAVRAIVEFGATVEEPFAKTTLDGMPGIRAVCSSTETDGTKVISTLYYVLGNDSVYYIELARTDRPTDTAESALEAVLASFRPVP